MGTKEATATIEGHADMTEEESGYESSVTEEERRPSTDKASVASPASVRFAEKAPLSKEAKEDKSQEPPRKAEAEPLKPSIEPSAEKAPLYTGENEHRPSEVGLSASRQMLVQRADQRVSTQ